MAEVTICSDFGAPKNKVCQTISIVSPSIYQEVMWPDAMILVFLILSCKPTFSLSSFTFINRLFSSSLLSAICCCSVSLSCMNLRDPMDCNTPGFLVLHYLLELAQTHVQWVGDAIQLSYPLSSPSPAMFNLSQHHSLFQRVGYDWATELNWYSEIHKEKLIRLYHS